ncbi:arginase family protein [Nocardia sp. SYP-A9097]|uniref:arginase family protein n=1 Tax=Nocardia sp. SYP-A9097 TaxID=2663237 RepID=UPI0018912C49|nr:arginase family protein [Nocardia sp. SYP-A9097]
MPVGGGADVMILGVPVDGMAGYRGGARFGPDAVRSASAYVDYDGRVRNLVVSETVTVVDGGDIDISRGYHAQTLDLIEKHIDQLHRAGILPVLVGGDHGFAVAELRSAVKQHGRLSLVQFAAHGRSESPATLRALDEGLIDLRTSVQIGVRGTGAAHGEGGRGFGMRTVTTDEALVLGPTGVARVIASVVGDRPTALSFGIDFVDPAFAPGTSAPEVGGPSSAFALATLRSMRPPNLKTVSLVEISPPYDHADITAHLCAAVLLELLALTADGRRCGIGEPVEAG